MTDGALTVAVIDDDVSVRRGLGRLLRSVGYQVLTFSSADDFLNHSGPDSPSCLVLDVSMPGRTGVRLHEDLISAGRVVPVVFITGHGDSAMAASAAKSGTYEVLSKPFEDDVLIGAIQRAIARRP